ncbi:hypothetical protein D9611_014465 [Ephemerocybe angulata]|uniref:CCHC-type domain-containing protein n=1 Tax=Ephemerocybe angulata TaxID=980116 RepID=A0A8H5C465_9AGAR|nr:hypothetical protein D9611_014465 [Tulosesus angulatus]
MAGPFAGAHDFKTGHNTFVTVGGNYIDNRTLPAPAPDGARQLLQPHIAPGALHNSADRSDAPKCHPETRVAVQDSIVSWAAHNAVVNDSDPAKDILWVTGPAGTGKTAIAGSVAETCSEQGMLAGAFFFSSFSDDARRRSKQYLVPTLAYQLVRQECFQDASREIELAIGRDPAIFELRLRDQLETLILGPLRASHRSIASSLSVPKVVIIDGLDECEAPLRGAFLNPTTRNHVRERREAPRTNEDEQVEILEALLNLANEPAFPFRIVLFSRPDPTIRRFFSRPTTKTFPEVFLDDKYDPDCNIALFLRAKFAEIRLRHPALPASWPSEDVIKLLVKSASGQFIYAATVIRYVDGPSRNPQLLLKQVLESRKRTDPDSPNPLVPLDSLYTAIIGRSPDPRLLASWITIISEGGPRVRNPPGIRREDTGGGQVVFSAFFWGTLLSSYPGEADSLLENVSSLMRIPPCNDLFSKFRFYHRSCEEFLKDPRRCGALYIDQASRRHLLVTRAAQVLEAKGPVCVLEDREALVFDITFFSLIHSNALLQRGKGYLPWHQASVKASLLTCDLSWIVYERSRTLPQRSGTVASASRAPVHEESVELATPSTTSKKSKSRVPASLAPSSTAAPQVTYASPDPSKTVFSINTSPRSNQISTPPPLTAPDQSTQSPTPRFLTPPASLTRANKRPLSSDSDTSDSDDLGGELESDSDYQDDEEQVQEDLLIESASETGSSYKTTSDINEKTMATEKTIADMPWRETRGAPRYGGDPRDLMDFFEQFEAVAATCNVPDEKMAEVALRYVEDREDREDWKALDGFEAIPPATKAVYATWKESVLASYAAEEKEKLRTFDDMANFIRTESSFKLLIKDETLTLKQENLYFWQGLHPETQKKLLARIDVVDTKRKPQDVPDIQTTLSAGEYVFSPRVWTSDIEGASARYASDEEMVFGRRGGIAVDEVDQRRALERMVDRAVRERERGGLGRRDSSREDADISTRRVSFEEHRPSTAKEENKSKLDEVEELARKLSSLKVDDVKYAGYYYRLCLIDPSIVNSGIPAPVFESQQHQFNGPTGPHVLAVMPQGYVPQTPREVMARAPAPAYTQRPPANTGFGAPQRTSWNTAPRTFANPLLGRCYFCGGEGHMAGFCAVGTQYIQEGRCMRDATSGRYYHADGASIWAQNGMTWKEAVDAKIGSAPQSPGPGTSLGTQDQTVHPPKKGVPGGSVQGWIFSTGLVLVHWVGILSNQLDFFHLI